MVLSQLSWFHVSNLGLSTYMLYSNFPESSHYLWRGRRNPSQGCTQELMVSRDVGKGDLFHLDCCWRPLVKWLSTIWLLHMCALFVFFIIDFGGFLLIALYSVCNSKSFGLTISLHFLFSGLGFRVTCICKCSLNIDTYKDINLVSLD